MQRVNVKSHNPSLILDYETLSLGHKSDTNNF